MIKNDELKFDVKRNENGKEEYFITKNSQPYIKVTSDLVEKTEAEIADWYTYLNNVIGFISFTFAIAVQGTPNVYLNAALSLAWVLMAHFWVETNRFPSHLAYLRKSKEIGSKHLAIHIEKNYLSSLRIAKKAPLFFVGYIYLFILTLMNFNYFKTIAIFGKTLPQLLLLK